MSVPVTRPARPRQQVEAVFLHSGVELSRSTLCRWAMQMADLLRPPTYGVNLEILESRNYGISEIAVYDYLLRAIRRRS